MVLNHLYKLSASALLSVAFLFSFNASATVFEFHFTGQYTLVNPLGENIDRQAIQSVLTYDSASGSGFSADLSSANFDTFGATATINDISMQRVSGTDLIIGNMVADWNSNSVPLSMVWDASGLFSAIDFGLQVGDVISGNELKRGGSVIYDVGSAMPASDGPGYIQGAAPLAVTTLNTTALCTPGVDCVPCSIVGNEVVCSALSVSGGLPLYDDGVAGSPMIDGPFQGLNVNFDIGSGNSLTVTSMSAVPVPAAVWLFGSGLMGLVGVARRNR
jgi:hypothetical protein